MGLRKWLTSWRQPFPTDHWEDDETMSLATAPENWETHPCELPLDIGITAVGQVWRCPECQRRWRLDKAQYDSANRGFRGYWTELMSATPVTDDELADLLAEDPDGFA